MNQPKIKTTSVEVATIKDAMAYTYGNQAAMARIIGVSRSTLLTKLRASRDYYVRIYRDDWLNITKMEWINQ